jgi:hypothetical protein
MPKKHMGAPCGLVCVMISINKLEVFRTEVNYKNKLFFPWEYLIEHTSNHLRTKALMRDRGDRQGWMVARWLSGY